MVLAKIVPLKREFPRLGGHYTRLSQKKAAQALISYRFLRRLFLRRFLPRFLPPRFFARRFFALRFAGFFATLRRDFLRLARRFFIEVFFTEAMGSLRCRDRRREYI